MSHIGMAACVGLTLSIASVTPALAIIHNSPAMTKRVGNGCPDGMKAQSFGHGATYHRDCVKKD